MNILHAVSLFFFFPRVEVICSQMLLGLPVFFTQFWRILKDSLTDWSVKSFFNLRCGVSMIIIITGSSGDTIIYGPYKALLSSISLYFILPIFSVLIYYLINFFPHVLILMYLLYFLLTLFIAFFVYVYSSIQFNSVSQSFPTLWPHGLSMPGFPIHHQLPEFAQTHVYEVSDAIQPSHSLSSPSPPPTFNLSQHQGLFKWVSPSHQVAKVLELQL